MKFRDLLLILILVCEKILDARDEDPRNLKAQTLLAKRGYFAKPILKEKKAPAMIITMRRVIKISR